MTNRARPLFAGLTIAAIVLLSLLAQAAKPVAAGGGIAGAGAPPEWASNYTQWPAFNYDLSNSRNDPYSQINASNVSQLRQKWAFPLKGAGVFGLYSTAPIVLNNVLYFQDTNSNVFALNAQTGRMLWERAFNSPDEGPNGLAYGYGRLYGATTTSAFALNASNGQVIWMRSLVRNKNEGIDDIPQLYNGTVIISTVPGNAAVFYAGNGIGIVYGLDAATGRTKWTFDTILDGKLWGNWQLNSGGGLWYPVSVDSSGRAFLGVANPAPFPGTSKFPDGSSHPGANLYTDSVVALNANTGKMLWYHQVTAHDTRDYDCMVSPVFANVMVKGVWTEVVVGACKSGQVVGLNANTGALLWQDPVGIHMNDVGPHSSTVVPTCPGALGGAETPMAYGNGVVYVPSLNLCMGESATALSFNPAAFASATGDMTAINVATGQKMWDDRFSSMNFGAATLSNNVLFTSTYNGKIYALNPTNGATIWTTQAPAGVNGWPAISGSTIYIGAGVVGGLSGIKGTPELIAYGLP